MVTIKDINKQLDDYFKDHRSLTDDEADAILIGRYGTSLGAKREIKDWM